MKTPLLLIIASFFLISCTGYDCARAETHFGFVGFTSAEANPIIFRKFEKGTGFSTLIDTILITPTNTSYWFTGDTLRFSAYTADLHVKSEFEYEMSLPSVGRTFRLGKIQEQFQSRKWSTSKVMCVNPVVGYELDGQTISGGDFFYIFLPK